MGIGILAICIICQRYVDEILVQNAIVIIPQVFVIRFVGIETEHQIEIMIFRHSDLIVAVNVRVPSACPASTVRNVGGGAQGRLARRDRPSVHEGHRKIHLVIPPVGRKISIIRIKRQSFHYVHLGEAAKPQIIRLGRIVPSLLAVCDGIPGVHAIDRAPGPEKAAPSPHVLISPLAEGIGRVFVILIHIIDPCPYLQPVSRPRRDVHSGIVFIQFVGIEFHQALLAIVPERNVIACLPNGSLNGEIVVLGRSSVIEHDSADIPVGEIADSWNVVIPFHHFTIARLAAMLLLPCLDPADEGIAVQIHAEQFASDAHPGIDLVEPGDLLHH